MEDTKYLVWKGGEKIPYTEDLDSEGYSYEIFIEYAGREALVFVCECGVHVEWEDQPGWVVTNISPEGLFGKLEKLSEKHLVWLLALLSRIGFEGKVYSDGDVAGFYEAWKNRNRDD